MADPGNISNRMRAAAAAIASHASAVAAMADEVQALEPAPPPGPPAPPPPSPPPPPPAPTYTLTVSPAIVNEGESVTFALATTGVPAGTEIAYTLGGAIDANDVTQPLTGALTVGADGTASLTVTTAADALTDGDEVIECTVGAGLAMAVALIRDTSQTPEPPPPPPAPPPPAPPPPAPAPPPPLFPIGVIQQRALDPSRIVAFAAWHDGPGGYKRWVDALIVTGGTAEIKVVGASYAANAPRSLSSPSYTLLVDGVPHATASPVGNQLALTLRASELAEGWHFLDLEGTAGESVIPVFVCIDRGGPPQPWVPVQMSVHDSFGLGHVWARWACVDATGEPKTKPLPAREYPAITTPVPRSQLVRKQLVPRYWGTSYRIRRSGTKLHTANVENYTFDGLTAPASSKALLDGPRGRGTVAMATHMMFGRGGKLYFTESERVGVISPDGTIRTLAGYRHDAPPRRTQPGSPATMLADYGPLVGDWSAIPAARHGFHELWGMTWDARTTAQGSGPPIPNPPGPDEPAHDGDVIAFVADSQRGRIPRLAFSGSNHDAPCRVTEFITGLADPWDCVCVDGVLYVSERLSHRIAAYDATTGAFLRVVVSGAALAHVDVNRRVVRDASLAAIRAERCVAPEGLYHLDGWLYFGSLAMAQVKRIHLTTGVLETVVADPSHAYDGGSNFFKIAVSDGTFGPRGTVFIASFAAVGYGNHPAAYLPDGTLWNYNSPSGGGEGPGEVWETCEYVCSVAVGQGRMAIAPSHEGIYLVSKALPGDATITWGDLKAARDAYIALGLDISHGQGGWPRYGADLPWGRSALADAHLRHNGWTPGE